MKDLVTVGFTRNEAVLLSPLFRKMFGIRSIRTCTEAFELREMLGGDEIIACSGSCDFVELDFACIIAEDFGMQVTACIFSGEVHAATLAIAEQNDIPIIIAGLESEDELGECVKAAQEGKPYRTKRIRSYKSPRYESFDEYFNSLSINERIACMGMLQGYKHDIIASFLGVSKSTADTYCSRVLAKFGLESVAELFQYFAFRNL